MKIKDCVYLLLTVAGLAACSTNDLVDEKSDPSVLKDKSYVAVRICAPSDNGSRTLAGFENGTIDENKVNSASFLFFDKDGNSCGITPETITNIELADGQITGNVEAKTKTLIVLENPTTPPTQMVVIINPSQAEIFTVNTTLSDVKNIISDYSINNQDGFVMSNSVYKDNDNNDIYTKNIASENIAKTETEALNNPVEIYVERVVAKVSVDNLEDINKSNNETEEIKYLGIYPVDNVEKELYLNKINFCVTRDNPVSYLIKNIQNNNSFNFEWEWNDLGNFRSYWANSAVPIKRNENNTLYRYYSFNDVNHNENNYVYCNENTSDSIPLLLVTGIITDKDNNPVELMEWKGMKFTKSSFKNYIANLLSKYRTKLENGNDVIYNKILPSEINFEQGSKPYYAKAILNDNKAEYYILQNSDYVLATENLKRELAGLGDITCWTNGFTYYFIKIEHNTGSDNNQTFGLVRNHVYKIVIDDIKGLGTAVFTPEKEIIPLPPPATEEAYISARVNILSWKVNNQNVTLGE